MCLYKVKLHRRNAKLMKDRQKKRKNVKFESSKFEREEKPPKHRNKDNKHGKVK